jgi:hypothetical protein
MIDRTSSIPYKPRIRSLIFLVAQLLYISLNAQDEYEEKQMNINTNRKYKNEAAIDISAFQFILGNSGTPSIFYRRHFTKKTPVKGLQGIDKTTFHAYRFRIGSNLSFEKLNTPDIKRLLLTNSNSYFYWDQNLTNNSNFFVRVGRENQIRSGRFELLYGYDFFYNSSSYNVYQLNVYVGNQGQPDVYNLNYEYKYESKGYSVGVAAIGGFKYFLIPRLCFSAEATLNIGYANTTKTNEYNRYDTSTTEYLHDKVQVTSSGVKVNINALFAVNIGYYF